MRGVTCPYSVIIGEAIKDEGHVAQKNKGIITHWLAFLLLET